jgi:hypothetical protein
MACISGDLIAMLSIIRTLPSRILNKDHPKVHAGESLKEPMAFTIVNANAVSWLNRGTAAPPGTLVPPVLTIRAIVQFVLAS